jgi:hypothetical protein
VRQRSFGVVVCVAGEHKYKVRFENDLEKVCFSISLRVESHELGVPLMDSLHLLPAAQQEEAQGGAEDADDEEEEEENDFRDMLAGIEDGALPTDCNIEADESKYLFGHQHEFLENLSGRSSSPTNNLWFDTPTAEVATAAAAVDAAAAIGTIAPSRSDPSPIATAAATAATDAGPVENPGINTGGGADATDGASHVQKLRHWKQKIKEMQGTYVEIKSKNQMVKWTIIEDVDPPMMHGPAERSDLRIQDFDFENMPRDEVFARMFFHLMWIGIDEQVVKFKSAIDEHNESIRVSRQRIKIFSKSELIVKYAVFVAAAGFSEKGIHLFDTLADVNSFSPPPSFSNYMKFHRFKVWKQFIVKVNEDKAYERDGNPWWKFAIAIDGFNDVCLNKITTSLWDILDESMSSFRKRTTATGTLPNISFIFRKPEPLGIEFKCVPCPVIGTMKWLKMSRRARVVDVVLLVVQQASGSTPSVYRGFSPQWFSP